MLAHCAYDGGKRARSPRRARRKPLKPLRREGRIAPANLWCTYSYAFSFCMRGCGCDGHPVFPAPSVFRGTKFMHNSGAIRVAGGRRHVSGVPGAARHERREMMRCRTGTHPSRGTHGSRFCEAALHAASRPGHEEVPQRHYEEPTGRANARPMTGSTPKQSILSLRGEMDCFACARNDGRSAV
jgi:hypothetical protein